MLETIPDDREHVQYKLMVARLYNAKLKTTVLHQVFGFDPKTMKRWGDALKKGDHDELSRVLAGRSSRKKLTSSIQSYIRMRFPAIYQETKYNYSQRMRQEIEQVFGHTLSAEAIRPLLKELKDQPINQKTSKRETACDSENSQTFAEEEKTQDSCHNKGDMDSFNPNYNPDVCESRKQSPESSEPVSAELNLRHHVGVLLFCAVFSRLDSWFEGANGLLKQWLATILLGAVNIEQTKLLDFEDLKCLLGKCLRSVHGQRVQLGYLSTTDTVEQLLRFNANEVDAPVQRDFYYDPHTKHYTGMQKILKGWCSCIRMADKALHMDFIHTTQGHPVFMQPADNYQDLRERFFMVAPKLRNILGVDQKQILTYIIDRGIYSLDVFEKIMLDPSSHLITWEKNFQKGEWNKEQVSGVFIMQRSRNHAADLLTYRFEYIDELWTRNANIRRLRVRAENPKGRSIEVGILTDDLTRPAQEIIELLFRRWIQENDFKYLDKHFGINEITSYAVTPYKEFVNHLEDKDIKSAEYKALQMNRKQLRNELSRLLLQEHQHPGKSAKRNEKIETLTLLLKENEQEMKTRDEDISRLEFLVEQDYVRLDTQNKYLMDALKILARNVFYKMLEPFKKEYDNFRDDHTWFRTLTQSNGILRQKSDFVEAIILPQPNYAPKIRRIMEGILNDINATNPLMPDGSSRKLFLRLGKKEEIELAIVSK